MITIMKKNSAYGYVVHGGQADALVPIMLPPSIIQLEFRTT